MGSCGSTLGFRLSFFGVTLSCCDCSPKGQLMVTLTLSTFCCRSTTICGSDTLHTGEKRSLSHQLGGGKGLSPAVWKGQGVTHRLMKTFPMQPVRLLRPSGSAEPPSWKSRRPSWRRCRRLGPGPVLLSCSSSSTYSRTLGVAAGSAGPRGQPKPPAAPTAGHVPTGIAVEGHVVGPAIRIGTVSGDFAAQQVQGQLAPLEGHPAHPLLQKASPSSSTAEPQEEPTSPVALQELRVQISLQIHILAPPKSPLSQGEAAPSPAAPLGYLRACRHPPGWSGGRAAPPAGLSGS